MKEQLQQYKSEMQAELEHILAYWMQHTVDVENGGFYGRINNRDLVFKDASKGSVLNSRILWSFSAAHNLTRNEEYLSMAHRAFDYIAHHFIDKEYGGVYWSVDYTGKPLDTKKQIYALAFALYGLTEYYRCNKLEKAKQLAIELYNAIEVHSYDSKRGGYIEALTQDWQEITDLRLSSKDANEKKSMNTHLHILEAYTNLFRTWQDQVLKEKIAVLIRLFLDKIICADTNHLALFFDEDWNVKSDVISYGHDIEAAWLVQEAAEVIGDAALIKEVKQRSVAIAEAAAKGLDDDGGLWYEREGSHLVHEKHWWPQSEAMVGFLNAWQLNGDERFLRKSLSAWNFVKTYILDKKNGEWFWGIKADHSIMEDEDKVGMWKCPYHNSRACMELVKRL